MKKLGKKKTVEGEQKRRSGGWLRRLFSSSKVQDRAAGEATVFERSQHPISRSQMSPNAVRVLNRLHQAGYGAYLVGGGVRDLMLEREPKDFDVATSATPEEVKALFRNCRLIGRRFRLAHVHFGPEIIEVATFRAGQECGEGEQSQTEGGMILRDNEYGTLEEDAWRRDFTINALYYNIGDFSVVDYTGGVEDLERGEIRLIGDPQQRYREDPVRMLRAVRFAVKLGFRIERQTEEPIEPLAHLLEQIPQARLYEEFLKMFQAGQALETFEKLRHYDLFRYLFPMTDRMLAEEENNFPHTFLMRALENTDLRVAQSKPITPAFLIAALLWELVRQRADSSQESSPDSGQRLPENVRLHRAGQEVLRQQRKTLSMPKRFALMAQEIWELQPRFTRRQGRQPHRFMENPRFRAAYDFLLLRAEVGEVDAELAQWWTDFQGVNASQRGQMVESAEGEGRPRKRRRRRRRKAANPASE
jgi:poly(A) polymerase